VSLRLLLVRHGETESNRQGLTLGRADIPLNDTGHMQAARVAAALAAEPLRAVYASPLKRAVETAKPIAETHRLPVNVEAGFIEMDIGELEGLAFAELRERYPEFLETWVSADGPRTAMPAGESLFDVQRRAKVAVDALTARHLEDSICVVTHNFVILSLVADALGIDLSGFRRLRHAVGAITSLELRPARAPRVIRLNDTCHLQDGPQAAS
jgi:broad specificity phosphatase PhoE